MTGRVFVDTNVLAYAFDHRDLAKFALARSILVMLALSGTGVVSAQVLSEIYGVLTKKLGLSSSDAQSIVGRLKVFEVAPVTD